MQTIKLQIITPYGWVFNDDILEASFPGIEGEFGVLPEHSKLLTILQAGIIEIKKNNGEIESIAIDSGYIDVNEELIVAIVEGAVNLEGDNESEMAKAIKEAKALVAAATSEARTVQVISQIDSYRKGF